MSEKETGDREKRASNQFNIESGSNSTFQDNRPEARQQQMHQEAANNSPQMQKAIQLQSAANAFVSKEPVQRASEESESEEHGDLLPEVSERDSGGHDLPPAGGEDGAFNPELGADAESMSWFRTTYLRSIASYEEANSEVSQLDLVLKAIHRNYGEWFANSNQGSEEEVAAKGREFKALEQNLIGSPEDAPGRYWCLTNGLELSRAIVNAKLEVLKSNTGLVEGMFKDSLARMESSPGTIAMGYASSLWEHAQTIDEQIFDMKFEIVKERSIAASLLEEGNTKFGGGVAKKGIALDAGAIAEERGKSGAESDGPISLHQDDGPMMALRSLKSAMVEYVRAVRGKEQLRDRLGVAKLKDVKKKTLKEEPGLAAEIELARKRKDDADVRFKAIRKIANDYLKGGLSSEIEAEVLEIDHSYLGLSRQDAADRVEASHADRKDKAGRAKVLGKVGEQMAISEAKYGNLRRSLAPMAEAGVGSRSFAFNLGVDFTLGIAKSSGLTISGGIKYSGKTDLQDDRKLRVNHSFGVSGSGSAELAGVLSASAGAELVKGKTEVFMDVDHWASVMAYRFSSITKEISSLDDTQQVLEAELSPEEAADVLSTSRLAEDKVTKVDSLAKSGSLGVGILGMGASGSYESKNMTFSKEGEEKTKSAGQTTKSVSVSPGSNISVGITRTIIDGHANPDNDGKYWNIKLELTGSAAAKFSAYTEEAGDTEYADWEKGLRRTFGTDPEPSSGGGDGGFSFAEKDMVDSASSAESDGNFGGIVEAISSYLGTQVAGIDSKLKAPIDLSIELTGSASFGIEWNFVNSGGKNILQYWRTSGGRSVGLSGSAPVGSIGVASVSIGAGASKGQTAMLSESLGTETLTYLQTVFNGLHVRDMRNQRLGRDLASEWETYIQGHDKEVWVALCKIGAGKGGAYAELVSAIASANSETEVAPDGVDSAGLDELQGMRRAAGSSGQHLLDTAAAHLGTEDISEMDAGKFALVKPALTAYLQRQGALDKKNRDLEWA